MMSRSRAPYKLPIMTDIPGYWMYETSGVLRPAINAYLRRENMTESQIGTMRAYLRQWISAPAWRGRAVEKLRGRVDGLTSREAIDRWITDAIAIGVDPL